MASSDPAHQMIMGNGTSSRSWCSEIDDCTQEEEDMANCLILLSQCEGPRPTAENSGVRKFSSLVAVATAGFYVYDCRTCDRSFRSFQALASHRATHEKSTVEKKNALVGLSMKGLHHHDPLCLQMPSKKEASFHGKRANRHECSICGLEFTSGQALGGHKKKHRPNAGNPMSAIIESFKTGETKPRKILPFDLNLPALVYDDHHHPHLAITENNIQLKKSTTVQFEL